ncbi:DUF4376 domain-containing protein [Pseudomonas rhizoryzae]|uniref:DUF4376 domain-containing protein n=1 Tax=Pseudomonas rhizoryzae TaxID=2571129 RepID=UPI0007379E87|nr:DUF4376 domain-containing protein [Pseudomonas rhizoryzae]KTT25135.1 hypothetical protein SB14R_07700 [Pseudomonas psychrotolerans]KTT33519.1 hypothetical protein SB9_13470 [Pseudomonas psychrotolerans]KTT73243.1 hypothetical protein SB18R_17715 [Pseudomonas psychrotolerans]
MDTITLYQWGADGVLVGSFLADPMAGIPERSTPTAPAKLTAGQVAVWNGQGWTAADKAPVPALPAVTADQVDAERDRRVGLGFEFQGKRYQTREAGDRENILGAMNSALAAIMAGAKAGDLRWADPQTDFVWIASDNQRVPMDAQTTLAFGQAATVRKSQLVLAGSALKAMMPTPQDFAADRWWPA